jgi:hypothetical protein
MFCRPSEGSTEVQITSGITLGMSGIVDHPAATTRTDKGYRHRQLPHVPGIAKCCVPEPSKCEICEISLFPHGVPEWYSKSCYKPIPGVD